MNKGKTVMLNAEHVGIFIYDITLSGYWDFYNLVYSTVWPFALKFSILNANTLSQPLFIKPAFICLEMYYL